MRKKALLFLGLCAFGLCAWEAQALNLEHVSTINMEDNVPTGYEVIVLQGRLDCNAGPNAVVAGANANSVYIHFNQSFGNVNISLYNPVGTIIYNSVIDTSVQQTVIIPILSTTSGIYTVELSNAIGLAEGDFERN